MTDSRVIEIPAPNLERLTVKLRGITPLITHRFGDVPMAAMAAAQQRQAKQAKAPRDPDAEYRDALYVIDEKKKVYGFPAAGVKKAFVHAGGRFADEKMTVLRGVLNVIGDLLPIEGTEPFMRRDHVRLKGGVSSIAYRPCFVSWSLAVPVVFNASIIREEQVLNVFQLAGFSVGLGDWRPECNGTFGQFEVSGGES